MLLQAEVNKAREAVKRLEAEYRLEKENLSSHVHLLNDPIIQEIERAFEIEEVFTNMENIAGIQVPSLERLSFKDPEMSFMKTPLWVDEAIQRIRRLKHDYQKVIVGIEKKEILEGELRVVSIRVNLFEKRLIPELEKEISQIRIFLGDQELQAVASAKVSKEKSIKRSLKEEVTA